MDRYHFEDRDVDKEAERQNKKELHKYIKVGAIKGTVFFGALFGYKYLSERYPLYGDIFTMMSAGTLLWTYYMPLK